MSYQQKENYISLITSVLVSVPYFIYVFFQYQSQNVGPAEELNFWASAILLLIPLRIVSEIVLHIISAIITAITTGKEESSIKDERDKLIDLKGTRNTYYVFAAGIFLSMLVLFTTKSISGMFVVMFLSGFFSEIIGFVSQIYYYHKGS